MANGHEINEELEFKERIRKMTSEERTLFVAEQTYDLTNTVSVLAKKFDDCLDPAQGRKAGALTGGITGTVTAILVGLANYFMGNKG
jgi:hypothetical protein